MNNKQRHIQWRWNDPSHLKAHRKDFTRDVEEILEELEPLVLAIKSPVNNEGREGSETGEDSVEYRDEMAVHAQWELAKPTGLAGLREVPTDGSESFWGYRQGRTVPSHLCFGEKTLTHKICLHGRWENETFVIHTIYPGGTAPREIHDPGVPLGRMSESIEFWSRHAIITEEGGFSLERSEE